MDNVTVFISGTPGTGKTTISKALFEKLKLKNIYDCKLVTVNDFVNQDSDLVLDFNEEKDYKEINLKSLDADFNEERNLFLDSSLSEPKFLIFEGHLTHFCSNPDKVIILRLNPDILEERLSERNYKKSKVYENLESEALDVCGYESFQHHPKNTYEIDVTNMSIDEILNDVFDIVNNRNLQSFTPVNFMDWLVRDDY